MTKLSFLELYSQNIYNSLLITFLCILGTYFIVRKHIYMLYDPLVLIVLMAGSSYSVVFILYLNDLIASYYFYSFLATQSVFFIGFICNKRAVLDPRSEGRGNLVKPYYSGSIKIIYPLSAVLFILSQLFVYYRSGIPLLLESRLTVFAGGDGYGIFSRVIFVCQIISSSISFYRLFFIKGKGYLILFDYFVILFCLTSAVLSGAKASILMIIFSMFYVLLFVRKYQVDKAIFKRIRFFFLIFLSLGVIAALVTISFQTHSINILYLLSVLAMRFVNTGDVFFMAYVNGTFEYLNHGNFFLALFKDYFGAFRIIDWQDLPTNLGLQIFWRVYDSDMIQGPNPRHNVFGLFYLGPYLSVIYSFVVGFSVSYLRNILLIKLSATPVSMLFYILMAANTFYIEQDTTFALGQYLSIFIVFIPIWIVSRLFQQVRQRLNMKVRGVSNG